MKVLTKEQIDAFEKAARPLIEWLNENCHPHHYVIVEPARAELVEGKCSVKVEDYIKD
jgi:hypothetical protein